MAILNNSNNLSVDLFEYNVFVCVIVCYELIVNNYVHAVLE